MEPKIIDKTSFIVTFLSFLLAFLSFFSETLEFMKSLGAAVLLGALVWISYIMIRCLLLAIKK